MANSTISGTETFNTAFPLDVDIKNKYEDMDLPILYIVDKIDASAPEQQIQIDINPISASEYTLKGLGFTPPVNPQDPVPDTNTTIAPANTSIDLEEKKAQLSLEPHCSHDWSRH